jgi:hypothetical protein
MRVKGTWVLDYARIIRATKDRNWDKYLKPEDWDIINGKVLPSNWYPYDFFLRAAWATFQEVGQGDLEMARSFGKFTLQNMLKVYKTLVVPGNPAASVEKLASLRRNFFEGGIGTEIPGKGPDWLTYRIPRPGQGEDMEEFKAFSYQLAGNIEELAKQAGARDLKVEFDIKEEGADITLKWSDVKGQHGSP